MNLNWLGIVRDVAIIFGLTFLGGFIIGFVSALSGQELNLALVGVSNIFFGTIGFAISFIWTSENRWMHLGAVVVGTWILSLINVALGFADLQIWAYGLVPIIIMMLLGSGIGYIWHRVRKTA